MSKLIVIDGVDASGKSTQTKKLIENLQALGKNTVYLDFPNYADASSALVKMYLSGELGSDANSINPYAAATFFAVDRYASYKKLWEKQYNNEDVIFICNRYTTSNAIHQGCKLEKDKLDDYLSWLFDFEYNKMGIPEPDMVIFFDMPIENVKQLLNKRYANDESKKDIHEKDELHLEKARNCALYLCEKYKWEKISCIKNSNLRSIDDIAACVLKAVEEKL